MGRLPVHSNFFYIQERKIKAHKNSDKMCDGLLTEEQVQAKLLRIIQQLQGVYTRASQKEKRRIRWIVGKFQQRGGFSPGDLVWLFQAMAICGIRAVSSYYPILLRTRWDKQEMKQLSVSAFRPLLPALTEEQLQMCLKRGIKFD